MHYCAYHKIEEPNSYFRVKANDKLDSWCIEGRKEHGREYSRKAYADRKAQVAKEQAAREARKIQICTECKIETSIEDFPFRSDRPGKRHAKCEPCLAQWQHEQSKASAYIYDPVKKKAYHTSHPGYNRESGRRRRSRLKAVRHEPYTDAQIRARDQWMCQICLKPIDPTLQYPDPWCEVMDHIHPISKKGPDVLGNVRQAHNQCNANKHTRYANPFADWEVLPLDRAVARKLATERHYLHRAPNTSFAFGLFVGPQLMGLVTFGTPSSWRINCSICPTIPKRVIELNRLWIHDEAPYGAASWFVSRALKQLPSLIIVSYADTSIQDTRNARTHDGSVYRALSFNYAGQTKPRQEWRMPGKARNVGKVPGAVQSKVSSKHRYWTVTGTPKQKKHLRRLVKWSI